MDAHSRRNITYVKDWLPAIANGLFVVNLGVSKHRRNLEQAIGHKNLLFKLLDWKIVSLQAKPMHPIYIAPYCSWLSVNQQIKLNP